MSSRFLSASLVAALALVPLPASLHRVPVRPTPTTAPTTTTTAPPRDPVASLLVDLDTGRVLVDEGSHSLHRPASTIKLLTVLTAQRHLQPDAMVPVSAYAASMPALHLGLQAGQTWPLGELISATVVVSANDAAVAIAEASGTTLDGFATQMADTGRALGMVDHPIFNDPAGLDDNVYHGNGDWISAWDLALVGRAAAADPAIVTAAGSHFVEFTDPYGKAHRLRNHNQLLDTYPGATGLKTGFTAYAGNTLIATATRGGRHMMGVILDAPDLYGSMARLLDIGFAVPAAAETGVHLVPVAAPHRKVVPPPVRSHSGLSLADVLWPAVALVVALAATGAAIRKDRHRRRRKRRHAARHRAPADVSPSSGGASRP